jgi:hypothetical protein
MRRRGIEFDNPGSYGNVDRTVVTGDGPTPTIAQNGIQFSFGATPTPLL